MAAIPPIPFASITTMRSIYSARRLRGSSSVVRNTVYTSVLVSIALVQAPVGPGTRGPELLTNHSLQVQIAWSSLTLHVPELPGSLLQISRPPSPATNLPVLAKPR